MKNTKKIFAIFIITILFQFIPKLSLAATVTTFSSTITPFDLAFDSKENLYTVNTYANTVSKITPAGTTTIFASVGNWPTSLVLDSADNIYVANYSGGSGETSATISKITPSGSVTTFATVGPYPIAIIFDKSGNLYSTSFDANQTVGTIYKITPSGSVSIFAKTGITPVALAFDNAGNLFVADNHWEGPSYKNSIYKVTPAGTVTTFAQVDTYPIALKFDSKGNLYTANFSSNTISKITPSGVVTNLASILSPQGMVFDSADNLYATSYSAGYVYPSIVNKIAPSGIVSIIASVGRADPTDLIFDKSGNLYTANYGDSTISKISSNIAVNSNVSTSWNIAGPVAVTGSGITQTISSQPAGTYTITWAPVAGYTTPAPQSLTLAQMGNISFAGNYTNSLTCGTAQDADGNVYNTVLVGTQCWMASNLKVGTKILGGFAPASFGTPTNNGVIEKFCYNNDDTICATEGGLYAWDEAMQYSTAAGAQGICPTGWHIPTDEEQYTLENYLKDPTEVCNANNTGVSCYNASLKMMQNGLSGMNFPMAGLYYTNGVFSNHFTGAFITSSTDNAGLPWNRHLMSSLGGVHRFGLSKGTGISVRCIKSVLPMNLVVSAGQGSVVTSLLPDSSINCGSSGSYCSSQYSIGTSVKINASILPGNMVFDSWTGVICTEGNTSKTCTFTMDADKTINATTACVPDAVQPLAATTCSDRTYSDGCKQVPGRLDCAKRSINSWKEVAP
jgi:uncharacterized protein (TIGR02145 family)